MTSGRLLIDLLLHLYPRRFRERFGDEMREVFRVQLENRRGRGVWATALLSLRTVLGTARGAVAEWRRKRAAPLSGKGPTNDRNPGRGSVAGLMEDVAMDVRIAVRGLRRQPVFAVASVGTLALAIGGVTALWSMVYAVLLKPLPYWDAPELARVTAYLGVVGGDPWPSPVAPDVFAAWTERSRTVDEFAAVTVTSRIVEVEGADRLPVALVSPNLFDLIGAVPVLGRGFLPEEGEPGTGAGLGAPVVLLSHAYWISAFGRDPAVVGRTLLLSGDPWGRPERVPHTIVGVLPPDLAWFDRPGAVNEQPALWTPMVHELPPNLRIDGGGTRTVEVHRDVIARIRPGRTAAEVEAELGTIRKEFLAKPAPEIPPEAFVDVEPVATAANGSIRDRLLLPFAAAFLVLALACLNVANLMLGRLPSRRAELGMREAVGAGRSRLIRQLGTESLVLAGLAAAGGAALAATVVRVTGAWAPAALDRLSAARVDMVALAFCAILATACAVAFGLAPAVRGSRPGRLDGTRNRSGAVGPGRIPIRSILLACELAIAIVLLSGAALVVRSFSRVASVDPGYRPRGVLVAALDLPREGYQVQGPAGTPTLQWLPSRARLAEEVVGKLESDPRVAAAGVSVYAPMDIQWYVQTFVNARPEGADRGPAGGKVWNVVTPGWFEAVGIPLLSGRDFRWSDRDGPAAERVAIVNQSFAALFWPGERAVGKRLQQAKESYEVVGVVSDERWRSLTAAPMPILYTPLAQEVVPRPELWSDYPEIHVFARAAGDEGSAALAPLVRDAVRELDPKVAVHRVETMEQVVAKDLELPRFSLFVLTAFGALAWAIAAAGVFGVLAYLVGQRTHEIGVRIALGGKPGGVAALVLRQVAAVAVLGVGAGVWGALAAGKLLESWLYEVEPTDPASLAAAAALLLTAAVAAAWVPVRRAVSIDPAETLRAD